MRQFERIRFPDGQISAKYVGPTTSTDHFLIKERINCYEDLFYIRSIADCLPSRPIFYRLFIPCMFGQRSDVRFESFQSFDLKLITDVINDCNFGQVEVFDPHSNVTLALINKSKKVSSFEYVKQAVGDIFEKQLLTEGHMNDLLLVSPDAGAFKKVFEFGEKLGLEVIGANKHRDKNGKIDLIFTHDVNGKDCLIVDDLCDGGYTFILLAKALKEHNARKVYLYISHGLFSKGFSGMYEAGIDHIYCTNSIKDVDKNFCIECSHPERAQFINDFITQYKII